ncbi:MAG: septum formation protein [Granulosicoccus sp.]|jgi:septum formation protein
MLDLTDHPLILASASPRRKWLLSELGLPFKTEPRNAEETYGPELKRHEIPEFLASKKADAFSEDEFDDGKIVLTSDTIVWINGYELNKPKDEVEAKLMLQSLSGAQHEVYTGICLRWKGNRIVDHDLTKVQFKELTEAEIDYYIATYSPMDKAGAYGIQEWIGYIGIEKIEGCYFNVMGLPLRKVYSGLKQILDQ